MTRVISKRKSKRKVLEYPNVKENHYYIYENGDIEVIATGYKKNTQLNGNGYKYVSLFSDDGYNSISVSIHRLVALNFLPRTEDDIKHNRTYVHFKNFDRKCISLSNIVWVNPVELKVLTNIYYDNPRNNKDYASYICKLLEKDYDPDEICLILGLPKKKWCPIIAKIYKKQIYKDISKKFKFK